MGNESICSRCSQSLDGGLYGSMGGNWDPYIPAKRYHIQCLPTVQELCPDRTEKMKTQVQEVLALAWAHLNEPLWKARSVMQNYLEKHFELK